ncbi:nitrile hydratase subunit beta [Ornithinimicrobium cavernae]|uniref:nitrile hydratase subunit beta n=1 Tax=Ornithinimicrobium cavernae TaxID=2666047 RepID=UPI000D69BFC3|nr:nitrile hydratase subunit beta [Ornithinimicrobium cavernae]
MNGVHDLGGLQSFGPVLPEQDEPVFHEEWERRALAITLALGALGQWNIDQSRHARESLPPATYLSSSYYEIWVRGLEVLMAGTGMLEQDGLRARTGAELLAGVSAQGSYERPTEREPRYAVGQRVRARDLNPVGHTRLPRYARGRVGTVVAVRGAHVFPDRNAATLGQLPDQEPEWLYTVDFTGRELWGEDADPTLTVSVDAWEPYLQDVTGEAA